MLLTVVAVIHIIVAVLLVITVLVQDSKGGGALGIGSSGTNQVLSSTNAAHFLVKLTRVLAGTFAITCITLTYLSTQGNKSVTDDILPPATTAPATDTAPTAPDAPAADATKKAEETPKSK